MEGEANRFDETHGADDTIGHGLPASLQDSRF